MLSVVSYGRGDTTVDLSGTSSFFGISGGGLSVLVGSTSAVVATGIMTGAVTGLDWDGFSIDCRDTDEEGGGVLSLTGDGSGSTVAATVITGTTSGVVWSVGFGVLSFSFEGVLFRLVDAFNGTIGTIVGESGPGEGDPLTGEGDVFFGDGEGVLDLEGFVSLSFITAPPITTAEAGTTESGFGLGVFSLGSGFGDFGVGV